MRDAYSPLKATRYLDRIEKIRRGEVAGPVHVQIILSDLCNQSCSFCLVAGTEIDTPDGPKVIEAIASGDLVTSPLGGTLKVADVSKRTAPSVLEVRIGERSILVTDEHPILTDRGWVPAESLRQGDRAVVDARGETNATSREAGLGGAAMPLRLRAPSKAVPAWDALGGLPTAPSAIGADVARGAGAIVRENAERQPDASPRRGRAVRGGEQGETTSAIRSRDSEYCSGGAEAHGIRSEPDAQPGDPQGGIGEDAVSRHVQERGPLSRVGSGEVPANQEHGRRVVLDRTTKPGREGDRSAQGDRGDPARVFHRGTEAQDGGGLRPGVVKALRRQGVALSGGLQEGSPLRDSSSAGTSDQGLRIAGLELERGLVLRSVDSIRRVPGQVDVYNFSCPPAEAYIANGVVVHNCAYRDPTYTSSTLFYVREDGKKGLRKSGYEDRNYNPNRMIPFAKVVEILDDCAEMGVRGIQYTGGGEPTVHPEFAKVAGATIERGLKWSLVTNGVNVHKKGYAELCSTAAWVRFSIDAATAETYCGIRHVPGDHFDSALAAIEETRRHRDATGSGTAIGVGFVVTPDNWSEVYDATCLAKLRGADNVRISAQFSADDEHLFTRFYGECAALCKQAESLTDGSFQVYNRFGAKLDDLKQGRPDYDRCGYQFFTTYIGGDQNLYRCCVYAYHPTGLYGSIKDRRFRDAWMDQARADGMAAFKAKECERCQFNKINSNLAYVLSAEDPEHAEFV